MPFLPLLPQRLLLPEVHQLNYVYSLTDAALNKLLCHLDTFALFFFLFFSFFFLIPVLQDLLQV